METSLGKKDEDVIFSKITFAYIVLFFIMSFLPSILDELLNFNSNETITFILGMVSLLISYFVLNKLLSDVPIVRGEKSKLNISKFIMLLIISYASLVIGYMITNLLCGLPLTNNTVNNDFNNGVLVLLSYVIIGPIFEELFFRKALIDRVLRYGSVFAVLSSAFFFMLYHGNMFQFPQTFLLGLILGCVYVKTRDIKYTILFHQFTNFEGSFVPYLIGGDLNLLNVYNSIDVIFIFLAIILIIYLLYNHKDWKYAIHPKNWNLNFLLKNKEVILYIVISLVYSFSIL